MASRSLVNLIVIVTLLVSGLVAIGPPAATLASGVTVSNDGGNDYWPSASEAPTGSTIVAAWNHELAIKVAVSTNNGASWSGAITIDNFSGTDVDYARVVHDSSGNVHLFFRAGQGTGRKIYYRYALAGSDPAQLSSWRGGGTICQNCINPEAVADNAGNVYVIFDDRGSGVMRIRRTNGPGVMDGTINTISGGGQGAMTVATDGRIHVAYLSNGNNIRYHRYTSWGSFSRELDTQVSTDFTNDAPAIMADNNGHVHIAWSQSEDNGDRGNRIAYYSEVINNGSPSGRIPISSSIQSDVQEQVSITATNSSDVYVSWTGYEEASGGSVYMNKRLNGTWGDRVNLSGLRISDSGVKANRSKLAKSFRGSAYLVYGEGNPLITKIFGAVPPDSINPTITNVTGVPFATSSQRVTFGVTANDPGATPSGVTAFEYSFDQVNYATGASFAPLANVSTNVNVDLANPAAGGSWGAGSRTIYLRARDAAGNYSAIAQVTINSFTPGPITTRYLAEGYTGGTFDEYLTLANPTGGTTFVSVRFQYAAGSTGPGGMIVELAPNQRQTVLIDGVAGTGKALSLKLESDQSFYAERPMYFQNYPSANGVAYGRPRASALSNINGGHLGVAATAPALQWYFAEGYTGPGFEAYFTIQNPNVAAAAVTITYYPAGGGAPLARSLNVNGQSRSTVFVHNAADPGGLGPNQAFSAKVESTNGQTIIVERVQYFAYTGSMGTVTGGTATLGAILPVAQWNFAEGYTGSGFDQFLTIQNPNPADGTATITYFVEGGSPVVRSVPLPANSRTTVVVHDPISAGNPGGLGRVGANSSSISATVPIVVERPMYFIYNGGTSATNGVDGGHNVMGATSLIGPGSSVVMAEGYTGDGFHEYLTFQNPNPADVFVTITYLMANGTTVVRPSIRLLANQRTTIAVHNAGDPTGGGLGVNQTMGVRITNTSGTDSILAERVMYFRYGSAATGGNVAFGVN